MIKTAAEELDYSCVRQLRARSRNPPQALGAPGQSMRMECLPPHWVTCPKGNPVWGGGGPLHSRPRRKWCWDNPRNTELLTNMPRQALIFSMCCSPLWGVRWRRNLIPRLVKEEAGHCNRSPDCHIDLPSQMGLGRAWSLFICPDSQGKLGYCSPGRRVGGHGPLNGRE